jgi:uncharacterized membrane protein YbhN (UPF0104 family)
MGGGGVLRRAPSVVVAGGAAAALVFLVPRSAGTSWSAVRAAVGTLTLADLGLLTALWCAGLVAHTFVLTASLPGLTTVRALMLNLSGSAVANVLPMGGAAGVGLNYAMARAWGYSSRSFGTFTAVSNLLSVLAKLAAGALGAGLVLIAGRSAPWPHTVVRAVVVAVVCVVPVLMMVLLSRRATSVLGAACDRLVAAVARRSGRTARPNLRGRLPALRADTGRVVRGRWRQLTTGMAAYLALQAALLWTCVHVLGGSLGLVVVAAALAVDRLLTMVPITPAGAGLVEAGTVAVLVALGANPVLATSTVLVYRTFTFLLEIPVGAAALALWVLRRTWTVPA